MDEQDLLYLVLERLRSFELLAQYESEEHDLQPHIREEIDNLLDRKGFDECRTEISVGGDSKKPHIDMFGTNFWPDVEVLKNEQPLVGIEVKYIRENSSGANALSESIGQSLIYKIRYPFVIDFVIHKGTWNEKLDV